MHGESSGPEPYLTVEEEEELKQFLVKCSEIGHGKTKREVFGIVKKTIIKKGQSVEHFSGKGWWTRFSQRHPTLTLRTSDPLSS